MAKERDAAQKRQQQRKDYLSHLKMETEKNTIRFRWAVNEHTPEFDYGDGWSHPIPARNRIVSPYFDTKEEAVEWMDRHEPDRGNSLNVVRHRLLRRTWTEWVNY